MPGQARVVFVDGRSEVCEQPRWQLEQELRQLAVLENARHWGSRVEELGSNLEQPSATAAKYRHLVFIMLLLRLIHSRRIQHTER